jgi:hypothetical protein
MISKIVNESLDQPLEIVHLKKRKEIIQICPNHNKLIAFYPNYNNTPLEIGVQKMVKWAIINYEKIKNENGFSVNIELNINLPDGWE